MFVSVKNKKHLINEVNSENIIGRFFGKEKKNENKKWILKEILQNKQILKQEFSVK